MGAVKVKKANQSEVDAFIGQLHGYGMQLKGFLMMQNLGAIETLSAAVATEARRYGLVGVAESLQKVQVAAGVGDFGSCMAAVSGFETEFHGLSIDYV